ncbi:RsmB/NOP family class I SAM-dependent RNA methyltransferase [Paenibacillus assamensis]|uniref:RsmB/NOP family class I SAM-dependent RNA methyltransferase n=1 Tax=Paenibacillus assamensis TaxID=311244 RepID=UPI0003FA9FDE|nr:RsmB/NOP family class I SAM-dependent RNA methyltransferase [Paenibacillus assamensis]
MTNINTQPILPETYKQQMKQMLGEETEAFLQSFYKERTYGLRIHPLKWELHKTKLEPMMSTFSLQSVPWCDEGYYYDSTTRPGKHPYHAAGLYYIQEPSAMSAVQLLDPQPGEIVLDLAAAPGGKTTHIAGRLQGKGLLIANEIHRERAKILASNVERMGCTNAIVTNSDPDTLAERFPMFFDRIMLDAPCSGEGMFRKDPDAIQEWSPDHVTLCATRQWDIIQAAVKMLKPGGTIAYSTCTFNYAENEQTIERWLDRYPDFTLVKQERIWPHKQRGEGHYVAVLHRASHLEDTAESTISSVSVAMTSYASSDTSTRFEKGNKGKQKKAAGRKHNPSSNADGVYEQFVQWTREYMPSWQTPLSGKPILFGEELYWLPAPSDFSAEQSNWLEGKLNGLRVPRPGLHLAHVLKQRIEPAHALALSLLDPTSASSSIQLSTAADVAAIQKYLNGEALLLDQDIQVNSSEVTKGWTLVAIDGLPIGWGKLANDMIKNHYPKGLRAVYLL